jgi:cytoskeletal protein CcmA (bactofilin family)
MWKARPDEKPATPNQPQNPSSTAGVGAASAQSAAPARQNAMPASPQPRAEAFRAEMAHIGKSVLIKGELSGSEDLYLDGEVEGSVELKQHSLTIGPHGRVRANVHAREVIVHGKVDGNLHADERVELKKSAILMGDIATQRIVIEDGAYFKGAIDIQKDAKSESRREMAMSAAASAGDSFEPVSIGEKKY